MPYADRDQHRKRTRMNFRVKYLTDPEFAEAERKRQREHYEANRERIIARVMARRAELKAEKAKLKGKK